MIPITVRAAHSRGTRPFHVMKLVGRSLVSGLLVVGLASFGGACASDKPTGPPADAEIKIQDTVFLPADVTINPGDVVEWINRSRDHRTVTSGLGPADSLAADDFDVDLDGYKSGSPDGEHYRRRFTAHPDTIYYFSRIVPPGFVGNFAGRIIVL